MIKYKIWKSTCISSGASFYILVGQEGRCVVSDNARFFLDTDSNGYSMGKNCLSFKDLVVVVDTTCDMIATDEEAELFCMVNGVDTNIKPLLLFAYKNKEEIFGED